MARQLRNPRFVLGNVGKYGRAVPFHAHPVFAGETMTSLKTNMNVMSSPIDLAQAGCTFDFWYYFVPFRLIWDNFPEWVMGDSSTTLATTNAVSGRTLWGKTGIDDDQGWYSQQDHALHEAYIQVMNYYHRDDELQLTTAATPQVLAIVDQSHETSGDADLDAEDETIDVSSGTLSIKALERKRAMLRYEMRVEMRDGKWTSWLSEQGVNASEALAQVPEFLGHYRKFIRPSKTISQTTGFSVQHYGHDCRYTLTKRRYFQEPGYVIGICSMRPKVHLIGGYDTSAYMFASPERFPQTGQLSEHKQIMTTSYSSTGGAENESDLAPSTYMSLDSYLFKGKHEAYNVNGSYILSHNPSSDANAMYPTSAWDTVPVTHNDEHYFIDGVISTRHLTPLNKLIPA